MSNTRHTDLEQPGRDFLAGFIRAVDIYWGSTSNDRISDEAYALALREARTYEHTLDPDRQQENQQENQQEKETGNQQGNDLDGREDNGV